jgi:hypothetical protein
LNERGGPFDLILTQGEHRGHRVHDHSHLTLPSIHHDHAGFP